MKCIAPMIPVWAERIEVKVLRNNRLEVRGNGRSSWPVLPEKSSVPIQGYGPKLKKPMHLEFANLRSAEAMVDYIRKYGPLNGKLWRKERKRERLWSGKGNSAVVQELTGKEDIIVIQELDTLNREQQLFRSAVRILSLLRTNPVKTGKMARLISQVGHSYPTTSSAEKITAAKIRGLSMTLHLADVSDDPPGGKLAGPYRQESLRADKARRRAILGGAIKTKLAQERMKDQGKALAQTAASAGHGVLCALFNRFPLEMFSCAGGAIELPQYARGGILPILYFLLRMDYRARHYLIKICPICHETFKSQRGESPFCDRKCYKKYNDHERYLQKKSVKK